jgi:mannose/fructose/N-acetylgalactosamine-specific phosphotransferase system component IID
MSGSLGYSIFSGVDLYSVWWICKKGLKSEREACANASETGVKNIEDCSSIVSLCVIAALS